MRSLSFLFFTLYDDFFYSFVFFCALPLSLSFSLNYDSFFLFYFMCSFRSCLVVAVAVFFSLNFIIVVVVVGVVVPFIGTLKKKFCIDPVCMFIVVVFLTSFLQLPNSYLLALSYVHSLLLSFSTLWCWTLKHFCTIVCVRVCVSVI